MSLKKNYTQLKIRHIANPVVICALISLLIGCSSFSPSPEPQKIKVELSTMSDVNLNKDGQSTPVAITIFELKSVETFNNSDYFAINDAKDSALNNDIAKRYEFIMRPGETQSLNIKPTADIIALGFVAAYREIERADWIKTYTFKNQDDLPWYKKLWPRSSPVLEVRFEKLAISIKEVD